jgi:hypothetical protein
MANRLITPPLGLTLAAQTSLQKLNDLTGAAWMAGEVTPVKDRVARWLPIAAAAGLAATFLLGILVPLYTDEIGWRFQERAWIDGVDRGYNDICGPNTFARPPWFMLPVRWFSATANQALADPLFVRIEGVLCVLAWAAMLWLLVSRLGDGLARRRRMQALVFSLLGLGTLPFLQVLSRPEQPLLLTFTLILLITLGFPRRSGASAAWLKGAAIVALTGIAVSYHLKGVAYAPIALVCLAVCAAGPRTLVPRVVLGAVLVAMVAAAASYWFGRFQCLGNAEAGAVLATESLAAILATHGSLNGILGTLVHGANPLNYVWLAGFGIDMSLWLPLGMFPDPVCRAVIVALGLLWGGALVLAGIRLLLFLARARLKALAEPRALLALTVLACVEVWGVSQIHRNLYEAGHILPMLAIFVALALSLPLADDARLTRAQTWLTCVAVPVALLSEAAVLVFATGPLIAARQTPGYIPGQRMSVSTRSYDTVRRDIDLAMAKAGMPRDRQLQGLVLDDITYLALQRHLLPIHRLGVFEVWNFGIDNAAQDLVDRRSDGIVVSCENLTDEFETAASRAGGICAVSKAQIEQVAAPPTPIWDDELDPTP